MNTPIVYEAPRFGRTGPGYCIDLRYDFVLDAVAYGLDAPVHIARGSTTGYLQDSGPSSAKHFISFTIDRSGQ